MQSNFFEVEVDGQCICIRFLMIDCFTDTVERKFFQTTWFRETKKILNFLDTYEVQGTCRSYVEVINIGKNMFTWEKFIVYA